MTVTYARETSKADLGVGGDTFAQHVTGCSSEDDCALWCAQKTGCTSANYDHATSTCQISNAAMVKLISANTTFLNAKAKGTPKFYDCMINVNIF